MATIVYSGSPRHSRSHSQSQSNLQQSPYHSHHHARQLSEHFWDKNSKRKSAVEMLAESKPFYVKSEMVLDRHQQLNVRGSNSASSFMLSPSRTLPPQHRSTSRRSASSGSDLLQTKLRKLLNADGKVLSQHQHSQLLTSPEILRPNKYRDDSHHPRDTLIGGKYDTYHGPKGGLSIYQQHNNSSSSPKNYHQQLTVHPEPQSDVSVFFPSAFLSPQSLPPHPVGELDVDDDLYSFAIGGDDGDRGGLISPPAEYAEHPHEYASPGNNNKRYDYQRSYSHGAAVSGQQQHGGGVETDDDDQNYSPSSYNNINSHKSLPDLHSQISRHSPHSEALSCCSRGNRSGSSSFNRDSGGSSGHYTHRSEQQQQQHDGSTLVGGATTDFRRDSGSSTQHSGNSYYAYGIPPLRYNCIECTRIRDEGDNLFNFPTPEVPEAFQDDYNEKKKYYDDRNETRQYYSHNKGGGGPTSLSPLSPLSPVSPHNADVISPPLGTFKRQKCLRFKGRSRYSASPRSSHVASSDDLDNGESDDKKPILRSKSDISDRYWNRNVSIMDQQQQQHHSHHSHHSHSQSQQQQHSHQSHSSSSRLSVASSSTRSKSDSLTELERFFDRLGLDDKNFQEHIAPKSKSTYSSDNESDHSSTVFFSDVSTDDSTRLPDSTDTQVNPALYRPSEPPSIIERNARIIKWLCNCKKLQMH